LNFHGERRSNATHRSTTDPDARLAKKPQGFEAKLSFCGAVPERLPIGVPATAMRRDRVSYPLSRVFSCLQRRRDFSEWARRRPTVVHVRDLPCAVRTRYGHSKKVSCPKFDRVL
jgi:hypothetical protein